MPGAIEQIRARQLRSEEGELAQRQHNLDWQSTFSTLPPADILRDQRDMTALVRNALDRRLEIAAETDAHAQDIWQKAEKFKAWQSTQPLRDDLLKERMAHEEASTRAQLAKEKLDLARSTQQAQALEHTALAQSEMDQLELSGKPEAEKRAWIASIRGRYPSMDKDATARHTALHTALNPVQKPLATAREWQGSDGAIYRFLPDGKVTQNGKPVEDVPKGVNFTPTKYMKAGDEIVNPATGEVAYKSPPKPDDPLKLAQQFHTQITEKRLEQTALENQLAKLTKKDKDGNGPAWLNTTGIFIGPDGGERFGFEDRPAAKSPKVTATDKAEFEQYQNLLKRRAELTGSIPQLEAKRDAVLGNGGATAAPTAAPAPNQAAMDWLAANPNDPRAAAVRAKLGIK